MNSLSRPCRDQRVDTGGHKKKTKKFYMLNGKISQGGREAFNRKSDIAKLISDRLKPDKEAWNLQSGKRIEAKLKHAKQRMFATVEQPATGDITHPYITLPHNDEYIAHNQPLINMSLKMDRMINESHSLNFRNEV